LRVPFFRLTIGDDERREVLKVLDSGWVTSGPAVRAFENRMRLLVHSKYAIAVSSATAGLHLALEASGIGPGDEVITSPFTMAATVEAILYTGATPIFADIDSLTLNIDVNEVERKISSRTRAIIPVDIAGLPCEYSALRRIARKSKLLLIEDAAHSFGATYKGVPIGSLTDATVFSFYSTKNITTGEGGMVITDSKKLADRIRLLSLHGMTSSGWKRYAGGSWKYDIVELGFKYNLSDLVAGLGLGQLARFKQIQKKRRLLAERYLKNLGSSKDFLELPHVDKKARHAWHLFIIKLKTDLLRISRDRFIEEMDKRGVSCGVHFIPIYHFQYFKKRLKMRALEYPNCESAFHRVVTLPFYPNLSLEEVNFVCKAVADCIKRFGR